MGSEEQAMELIKYVMEQMQQQDQLQKKKNNNWNMHKMVK